jgi:phage terminase small subunit
MGKKLTVKQTKLVKAKAKGKTMAQAAKDAGYLPNATDETRRREAYKTIQKPHVKEALDKALIRHGITLDTAIAPIGKALTAMKQNEFTGEITEDIQTQLKGSDRALKLMGIQSTETPTNQFIQIVNEQTNKYV